MAVLRVPQDYETIQQATDAAKPGDTIVADATYSAQEYVTIGTDSLTIGADKAAQQITLALQGDARHLTLSGDAPIAVNGNEMGSVIQGNAGDNVIKVLSPAVDVIDGGDGNDVIVGYDPSSFATGGGADQLSGGRGNDTFNLGNYNYEGAVIDGGDGTDTIKIAGLVGMTLKNLEILDGNGHVATAEQYNSFKKIIDSDSVNGVIGVTVTGSDGTADFSSSVTGRYSIALSGELATSGMNVIGSNNGDSFNGSQFNDVLNGGKGNDIFTTSDGSDTLNGGDGDDVFVAFITSSEKTNIDGGAGTDTIQADDLHNLIISDVEILDAHSAAGSIEQLKEFSKINFSYDKNSDIYLSLSGSGGTIDFRSKIDQGDSISADGRFLTSGAMIIGSSGNDALIGSAFDDRLDGWKGADRLSGGKGNDTFIVDNRADLVFEDAGQGTDTVVTKVSYALQAGQEIEVLQADGGLGSAAIDLTGNEFAQTIQGTSGANVLNGGGGADRLYGYGGNDTYIVDNVGDRVFESRGGGTDTVLSSTNYTLQAGQEIENLQLLSSTGKAALNLTGNEFAQTLVGNNGANVLDGQGGADTMTGRGGNDTYLVDNQGDRVVEAAKGGHDTVIASVSYALQAGQEIETLAAATGTAAYSLVGNAFDNALVGNAGNNKMNGGLGNDLLTGGAGRDTFVFDTTLGANNVDHITDFAHGIDAVRLAKSLFTALGAGHLAEAAFKDLGDAGAKVDADDRILYDHKTGDLSYDADGSGTAFTAVRFAVVDNHGKAHLDYKDILIA